MIPKFGMTLISIFDIVYYLIAFIFNLKIKSQIEFVKKNGEVMSYDFFFIAHRLLPI